MVSNLEDFLTENFERKITNLVVVGCNRVNGVNGIVKSIEWHNADGHPDSELTWITVQWDNGNISYAPLWQFSKVKVQKYPCDGNT